VSEFSAYKAFGKLAAEGFTGTKLTRSLGKYAHEWVYFGLRDGLPGLYLYEPNLVEVGSAPNRNLTIEIENVNILGVPVGNYLRLSPTNLEFDLGLFSSICDEFIRISDSVLDGYSALQELLARWSALLKISSDTQSTNAMVGLYGELLCLVNLLENKESAFLEHWTGPDSARHDFEGSSWAIEVKSSTVLSERRAVIHGTGQLESGPKTRLALLHYQLEWAPGAESLPQLAARVLDFLSAEEKQSFRLKLEKLGYSIEKISQLNYISLKINRASLFTVSEEFPRITRTSLGKSSASISRVDYWLNLEGLPFQDVSTSFGAVLSWTSN
jgi:hypothetical protein